MDKRLDCTAHLWPRAGSKSETGKLRIRLVDSRPFGIARMLSVLFAALCTIVVLCF